MFATIRRYESVDESRTRDLVKKVDEGLAPKIGELTGFHGYYLVDAGSGVLTSIGLFDSAEQCEESSQLASKWLSEEKLAEAVPNPPKVTTGEIVVDKTRELIQA
jgi:hypothetical protein